MKVSGLDGYLRPVKKCELRPSSADQSIKQWSFAAPPALRLNKALLEFVLQDGLHSQVVEGDGFKSFVQILEPRYVIPSRVWFSHVSILTLNVVCGWKLTDLLFSCIFLQTYVPALYCKVKAQLVKSLHDGFQNSHRPDIFTTCPSSIYTSSQSFISLPIPNPSHPLSLTTDLWTGADHESYICLTAHWFDLDWSMRHALLDILLCTDRHTGENLVAWMKDVLQRNEICV
jgi:hypothetical protein